MTGRELAILTCDWLQEMAVVQHCRDEVRLQQTANTIALMARKLSKDPNVSSIVFCPTVIQLTMRHYIGFWYNPLIQCINACSIDIRRFSTFY